MAKKTATREEVYKALDSERDYQDSLWDHGGSSGTEGDGTRTLDEMCAYMVGYSQKLLVALSTEVDPTKKLDIVRKVAALGVSAMEQHGAPHRES